MKEFNEGAAEKDKQTSPYKIMVIVKKLKHVFQSRFDARYWMLGAGALRRPKGMVWGGRREEASGWGTHVYLWLFILIFRKTNTIM